jgi:hypothetical protein
MILYLINIIKIEIINYLKYIVIYLLLQKNTNINIIDDFKKSIILNCLINEKEFNKSILEQIYKIINDRTKIKLSIKMK